MNLGIVGCTGAVGLEILKLIEKRQVKYNSLRLFASKKSLGRKFMMNGNEHEVEELKSDVFKNLDCAIFSVNSTLSKKYSVIAINNKCTVIDNSSAFRMDPQIPLVIPEINIDEINRTKSQIIANPNCSTIILNMVIGPINNINPIEKIIISTYQAASGAGLKAMIELKSQAKSFCQDEKYDTRIFGRQFLWNAFSHDSKIMSNWYNEEEMKMVNETRKILKNPNLKISATCVRIPVLRAHCESVSLTLQNKININEIYKILEKSHGVKILDDRQMGQFPEPIIVSKKNDVFVGRIRKSLIDDYTVELFIVGDQLLKGAALNAIQIYEIISKNNSLMTK